MFSAPDTARADSARLLILDAEETSVRFTLGATLHAVEGSVRAVSGEIRFYLEGGPAAGEVVIDALSAETGNDGRDRDMHKKVLESGRFGRFVLRPTELIGEVAEAGASQVELRGELEIHGSTHAVSLPSEVTVTGDRLAGTARLHVPYVEWGMKNPSKLLLRVDKFVEVEISLAGQLHSPVE
jgi:polyisoprenoid-binding protein YceI